MYLLGSRGDVQPFVGLLVKLQEQVLLGALDCGLAPTAQLARNLVFT